VSDCDDTEEFVGDCLQIPVRRATVAHVGKGAAVGGQAGPPRSVQCHALHPGGSSKDVRRWPGQDRLAAIPATRLSLLHLLQQRAWLVTPTGARYTNPDERQGHVAAAQLTSAYGGRAAVSPAAELSSRQRVLRALRPAWQIYSRAQRRGACGRPGSRSSAVARSPRAGQLADCATRRRRFGDGAGALGTLSRVAAGRTWRP
jgi:hypothetical protein